MTTTSELLAIIEAGLDEIFNDSTEGCKNAYTALAELRQRVTDLEALSDAVEELSRIEKAYTRLPDNTWPEWRIGYEVVYDINYKLRKHD